jgi:hypothetical protein
MDSFNKVFLVANGLFAFINGAMIVGGRGDGFTIMVFAANLICVGLILNQSRRR